MCRSCEDNMTQTCLREKGAVPLPPNDTNPKDRRDDWRITRDQVTEWEEVGGGTWGIVYKAKWFGSVAVKKLKCKNPTPEQVKNMEKNLSKFSSKIDIITSINQKRKSNF